ncbi:hypothetical protein T492DRAFT_847370 [Pavlovales sp. CCMP2436]|nr:hypothetical protein T492DRAFT_847370 [Pavlovales sp. CCMP2436]
MALALALLVLALGLATGLPMPAANPRGTANRLWQWRSQQIRYQALGDDRLPADAPSVVFVHGLPPTVAPTTVNQPVAQLPSALAYTAWYQNLLPGHLSRQPVQASSARSSSNLPP